MASAMLSAHADKKQQQKLLGYWEVVCFVFFNGKAWTTNCSSD